MQFLNIYPDGASGVGSLRPKKSRDGVQRPKKNKSITELKLQAAGPPCTQSLSAKGRERVFGADLTNKINAPNLSGKETTKKPESKTVGTNVKATKVPRTTFRSEELIEHAFKLPPDAEFDEFEQISFDDILQNRKYGREISARQGSTTGFLRVPECFEDTHSCEFPSLSNLSRSDPLSSSRLQQIQKVTTCLDYCNNTNGWMRIFWKAFQRSNPTR